VLLTVLEFLWWLQPAPTGGPIGDGAAPAGAAADGGMGCAMQAGLFAVMMLVFYFFLLRPEQKRRREHEDLLKSLRKGTKVRTSGGILGEVITVTDDEVVLSIADRVRVNVLRANIASVESARKAGAEDKKADDKKADDKKKKDEPSAKKSESDEARDEA
jgi:preprotein translocase subunit YajC